MLVVYYCAVDISDCIVLCHCKLCLIVIFSGVKLLAQLLANLANRDNLAGTAVKTIGVL